jgi:hypothetical protein
LLTALKGAGYDSEPLGAADEPEPEAPAKTDESADNTDELPRFVGAAAHNWPASKARVAPKALPWIKRRRRAPWRERLRNGVAWIATILVVGVFIWGAAQVLSWGRHIPPPNGPASPPGPGLIP